MATLRVLAGLKLACVLFGGAVTDTCVTEQVEIYCPTTDVWTVRAAPVP
jgi:hypothetical protein